MDLTIDLGAGRLNVRVSVLVKTPRGFVFEKIENYYVPIGGRIQLNETAEQAARRETREECGIELAELRFGTVIENFYRVQGLSVHEFNFVYRAEYAAGFEPPAGIFVLNAAELGGKDLRPAAILDLIRRIDDLPPHLVIRP
jgi:8-oxo-dGTP pyrophosphatase MutT (NUDIX family)